MPKRKTKSTTKPKAKQTRKGIRRIIPKSKGGKWGLAVLFILIGIVIGGFIYFNVLLPSGEGGQGWMKFQFIDGMTGEELDGEVVLVQVNHTDKKLDFQDFAETKDLYDNPVKTGDLVYVPERSYAVVWDVDLEPGDTREWLPLSISPIGSELQAEAKTNTFIIWFYNDPDYIVANITEIEGVEVNATLSDFPTDTKFDIVLSVNNTDYPITEVEYETYGASSWIPEYWLDKKGYDLSLDEKVYGLGLWLGFNGTEIAYADVQDNGEDYTDVYYIEEWDAGIVLLDIVMTYSDIDITLELKDTPTEVFLFEGFLEDIANTKITLIQY